MVVVEPGDRIHFLDWGGPDRSRRSPGVLLIHGLSNTAWSWTPVARRLRAVRRVVAMDLRGHGLSDAPTDGYDPDTLADDVLAVAEGSGLLAVPARPGRPGRSRVRGDRRGLGGRGARRPVRGSRARRRWLGIARGRERDGRRRVPARARRAAGGHALDDGLPRRSAPPSTRRPGTPTRKRRRGRPSSRPHAGKVVLVDATACARGERADDVRVRPDGDPGRGPGAGRRARGRR